MKPPLLSGDEIGGALASLPGWRCDVDTLRKTFAFDSFADAVVFVVRLGFAAEAADHHPDLDLRYRNVTVAWSTHVSGGVTARDVDLAGQTDHLATALGVSAGG